MENILKKENGVSLIELLVALVISSLLTAALYRTFVGQQKTYAVQEQVVDIQQNVRFAISSMMREIKMAGFGNIAMILPPPGITINGRTYTNVVNPDTPVANALTILSGSDPVTTLTIEGSVNQNQVTVSTLVDAQGNQLFDTTNKKYISIGGVESNIITAINVGTRTLTFQDQLSFRHVVGTPVYSIRAITYQVVGNVLMRDDGGGSQPVADGFEMPQFQYLDEDGNVTAIASNIRIIRVSLIARTSFPDPDYKSEGGYRRREIASNIHLRNMGI